MPIKSYGVGDFGRFLLLAAIGNAIGGSMFVALLKFGSVHTSSNN